MSSVGRLEVVADPDGEAWLAEFRAAAGCSELQIFPLLVEQRAPRPVEVNRGSEREGLEAEAVGGAAVLQAEPADGLLASVNRNRVAVLIDQELADRVGLVAD